MDLLVEKLDGSRYYLSQYKVLITDFEESAPSVTRNSTQLDQRNGNIDFGGWHTDKTINITGYYRADDIDEEEVLREKLYALLSDPDGYYITQLKTTPKASMERPGETSGSYYDKLSNYPSHKRFLVYTEAPEMELVGNVGGTLLYKLTAEFKTIKLPYGESVPRDLDVKPNVPYYGRNLITGTSGPFVMGYGIPNTTWDTTNQVSGISLPVTTMQYTEVLPQGTGFPYTWMPGVTYTQSIYISTDAPLTGTPISFSWFTSQYGHDTRGLDNLVKVSTNVYRATSTYTWPSSNSPSNGRNADLRNLAAVFDFTKGTFLQFYKPKLEQGNKATDWSPAPEDPDYNEWYFNTYYNTNNLFIPYAGTVPCNQLEQGFAIEFTAEEAASSLSFKIDDTELTYSGAVASGDVFMFSGFSYTQNSLSIVSETNKAYFILQPDKPNRITCNVHGTVRILGFKNLYA